MAYRVREDERQRVAAQVHDTLGHVLTLVVLHAHTLATAADPAARETGAHLSKLGTQGLTQLRRILTLLDAPAAEPPDSNHTSTEESVRGLVEQARAADQQVTLHLSTPLPTLTPAVASAVVRTVQEGLTNARRHAPGGAVEVELTTAEEIVRLTVRNEPGGQTGTHGEGRGLAALDKRIDLLGGKCEYASTANGGYALRVELPATSG